MDVRAFRTAGYTTLQWLHTASQCFMYAGLGYLAFKLAGLV